MLGMKTRADSDRRARTAWSLANRPITILVSRRTLPLTLIYPLTSLLDRFRHQLYIGLTDSACELQQVFSGRSPRRRHQAFHKCQDSLLLILRQQGHLLKEFFSKLWAHGSFLVLTSQHG